MVRLNKKKGERTYKKTKNKRTYKKTKNKRTYKKTKNKRTYKRNGRKIKKNRNKMIGGSTDTQPLTQDAGENAGDGTFTGELNFMDDFYARPDETDETYSNPAAVETSYSPPTGDSADTSQQSLSSYFSLRGSRTYSDFRQLYDDFSQYYETISTVFALIDEENINELDLNASFPGKFKKIKFLYCSTMVFLLKLLKDIKKFSSVEYVPKVKYYYDMLVEKVQLKIDLLKKYNNGSEEDGLVALEFYPEDYCKKLFASDYKTLTQVIIYTLQSIGKGKIKEKVAYETFKKHVDSLEE